MLYSFFEEERLNSIPLLVMHVRLLVSIPIETICVVCLLHATHALESSMDAQPHCRLVGSLMEDLISTVTANSFSSAVRRDSCVVIS